MGNDPVNNVDPDGGNAIAGAVIGGITGFIAGGIVALANDGDPVKGAFLGAVGGALIGAGIGGGSELVNSLNISAKTVGQVAVPVLIQGSDQVAKRLAAQTVVTTVTNIATPSAPTSIPNNSGIDLRPVVNNAATKVTTPNNITQQPPVKRTTPPTANPRPRPTIPPPPTAGNATTAELAQRLIRGGRVGFAATHANRRFANDDANADDNIRDAAAGRAARTSVYGDAHGRPVNINPRLLSIIDALSQTYRLGISEIAGGDHSTNSQHYQGNAVDINSINGIHVTENNPYFRQLMRDARRLGIGLTIGPPSAGHATHVHLQLP